MKKTGEMLKNAREAKNLSLSEVSLATKINTRVLKAIEEGDKNNLPQKTFLRGFVRSYANHLKMDTESVLEMFAEEMGSTVHQPKKLAEQVADIDTPSKAREERTRESAETEEDKGLADELPVSSPPVYQKLQTIQSRWLKTFPFLREKAVQSRTLMVAAIVLLIGLILVVKSIVDKYEREKRLGETPANVVSLKQEPVQPDISKETLQASQPAENAEGEETKSEDSEKSADKKEVAKEEDETPKKKKPVTRNKKKNAAMKAAQSPTKTRAAPENAHSLIVEAIKPINLTFKLDDEGPQVISLNRNEIHTFKAKNQLTVSLEDGSAVHIIHNGKDQGRPGEEGEPAEVTYP